jgi:lipoyl(octanoyl) transferase
MVPKIFVRDSRSKSPTQQGSSLQCGIICFFADGALYKAAMEWKTSENPVDYDAALAFMDQRVADIHEGKAGNMVWLLEHPPLYTSGTSAKESDLLERRFPVYYAGRGGEYTYHGPGQRVAYVMMDLKSRGGQADIKAYVCALEKWAIAALAEFGIKGEHRDGRIGVWVDTPAGEKKIAAVGVRVRRWIAFHGIAINVHPDLSHFGGIVPCGISEYGVTSMAELLGAEKVSLSAFDEALKRNWDQAFNF